MIDRVEPRLAHHPLALLLRAPVGGLDRQLRLLGQQLAVRVAGDDRRGEHEARRAVRLAGVDQRARALDVGRRDLARVALRAVLGRQVHDPVGALLGEQRRSSERGIVEAARRPRSCRAARSPAAAPATATSCSRRSNSAQRAPPRKPLAPVTSAFTD